MECPKLAIEPAELRLDPGQPAPVFDDLLTQAWGAADAADHSQARELAAGAVQFSRRFRSVLLERLLSFEERAPLAGT